jgi:putative addiction module CopG family antidote
VAVRPIDTQILDSYFRHMDVHLSPDQEAFIRQAIDAGRFQSSEEAVQEAMHLWEERERRRLEILAAVDKAEASLARGEGQTIGSEAELGVFASDIGRRGLERLSSQQKLR